MSIFYWITLEKITEGLQFNGHWDGTILCTRKFADTAITHHYIQFGFN